MMITEIALVSRAKMEEFRTKCGGVTFSALDEIMNLNVPGTWELAKYLRVYVRYLCLAAAEDRFFVSFFA